MGETLRDEFEILDGETSISTKIKRSEFIAYAFPATRESDLRKRLDQLAREHHASRHLCWAGRWLDQSWEPISKSSDAGEPSGTAGKPILQAIESRDLFATGVVVVRYFGGVKLGTGGLVRAYGDAASAALATAPTRRIVRGTTLRVETTFDRMNDVYRLISPPDVTGTRRHSSPSDRAAHRAETRLGTERPPSTA